MKPESLKALGAIDAGPVHAGPVERFRREAPAAVGKMAEIAVDNPGQVALIMAGSMVAAQAALNLVRPRTPAQALALFVLLQVALPRLAWAAVEKGWITFRLRDADGNLVPLVIGETAP